jgi:hypothetical protein
MEHELPKLHWSRDQKGNYNGKRGPYTLFVVSYYPERGVFVAPKLPGLGTVPVSSLNEGRETAEALWESYLWVLNGE